MTFRTAALVCIVSLAAIPPGPRRRLRRCRQRGSLRRSPSTLLTLMQIFFSERILKGEGSGGRSSSRARA